MEEQKRYVIVTGNPIDGLQIIGTYDSPDEAAAEAGSSLKDTWWVAPLEPPERDEMVEVPDVSAPVYKPEF
jgi:hypothetical protein